MKIGYITTPYFGLRTTTHPKYKNDEIFYVKKHLEFLKKQTIQVDKIYLICTFSEDVDKVSILEQIKEICKGDSRFIIHERENLGASYASWKYAFYLDKGECDYIALIEDDYCLYNEKAIEIMVKYFKDDDELFYLCQYWDTRPYQSKDFGVIPSHAAMSNGLLDNKKYYNLFLEKNFDFRICYGTSYDSFCDNQAMFLEDYREAGLKIIDWRESYSSYFPNSDIEYGNPNGLKLMIPLQDDLGYF